MSIHEIDRTIQLDSAHVFNHHEFVNKEIEKFRNAFERNDRFNEFEGLLKKDHKVFKIFN